MGKRLLYRTLPMVLFLGAVYGFLASPLTPVLAAERTRQVETTVGAQEAIKALVIPLPEGSHRTIVNLRGDEVLVPTDVPPKKRFVFRRLISVKNQYIVFLYSDPRFGRPVDYAETYNVHGELLEIAWYKPAAGVKRVRDINLGKPNAKRPARILNIPQKRREDDQRPASAEGNGRLALQDY